MPGRGDVCACVAHGRSIVPSDPRSLQALVSAMLDVPSYVTDAVSDPPLLIDVLWEAIKAGGFAKHTACATVCVSNNSVRRR